MFQNKIVIQDNCPVITNPQNKVTVSGKIIQYGIKYYTIKTIWNFLIVYVTQIRSYFQR